MEGGEEEEERNGRNTEEVLPITNDGGRNQQEETADDQAWVSSFAAKVRSYKQSNHRSRNKFPSIYKLSPTTTTGAGDPNHSFRPSFVAIGPYHRGQPDLMAMETMKWRCVDYITRELSVDSDLEGVAGECLRGLREMEADVRRSYSEAVEMGSDELAEMLLLDSVFIVLLLAAGMSILAELQFITDSRAPQGDDDETEESMVHRILAIMAQQVATNCHNPIRELDESVMKQLNMDVLLLENQIPFVAVDHVWEWLKRHRWVKQSADLDKYLVSSVDPCRREGRRAIPREPLHLLHLLHNVLMLPLETEPPETTATTIPSATSLVKAGLRFRKFDPPDLHLGIGYEGGVIEIPEVTISNSTRMFFQNLLDFEQTVPGITCNVTAYIKFMTCLLRDDDDVRLLVHKEIVKKDVVSDHQVVTFFDELCRGCTHESTTHYLVKLVHEINARHSDDSSASSPLLGPHRRRQPGERWIALSVVAVVVLLVLTFLQSLFVMYSYFHPPK